MTKLFSVTNEIVQVLQTILKTRPYVTIAIDGRCASGKTTLAFSLSMHPEVSSCTVFHMDDFFLRPSQRTPERLSVPGENVDHERVLDEVLIPLYHREIFTYRPYDCHTQSFSAPVTVVPPTVAVVEGSYACHHTLWEYYDLRILLDVSPEIQMARILTRNGRTAAERFRTVWIPLEESYFATADLQKRCDMVFDMT